MPRDLSDSASVSRFLRRYPIGVLYFTTPDCGVCKVLRPKLSEMLTQSFPGVGLAEVDCAAVPDLAAQMGVFTAPTLIVFTEARESLRRVRAFGLDELAEALERPYGLLYRNGA